VTWRDLVFSGGVSGEGYRGNLASVTATAVDSTDRATAAVGEMAVRGGLWFFTHQDRELRLDFDGGLRQFVAGGFEVQDYAPMEWVGNLGFHYRQTFEGLGVLAVQTGGAGRGVTDRPPPPLHIQPGYASLDGEARFSFYPVRGVFFDAEVFGERTDYGSTDNTPQLDLLDRSVLGLELGASWGVDWNLRFFSSYQATEYGNQGTFDPSDPFRKDRTLVLGSTWTVQADVFAQLSLETRLNRSNSSRPEYNAFSFSGVLSAPLPWWRISANLFATLTGKDYLTETEYARLVPGEEADNASVVYLELTRPLDVNLDGAVRFGWTRAETDIGDSYFERFGVSFLLRYRPFSR
jgi:hypothetical protein